MRDKTPELWLLDITDSGTLRSPLEGRGADLVRASCGADVHVDPGVLHALLLLPRLDALEPVRVDVIFNRTVRPLLRAISKTGALAHYFGRDWIAAEHRPVALLGFAHNAITQRTLVEAFIGVTSSPCGAARASYQDKEPTTIAELAPQEFTVPEIAERIESAFLDAYGLAREDATLDAFLGAAGVPQDVRVVREPPPSFVDSIEEAIGPVRVGRDEAGRVRFGGELMISFDALEALEEALCRIDTRDTKAVAQAVETTIGRSGVALFGVRSLDTFVHLVARS